ncbi:MAG: SCO family protein [Spirochaetia bacterium]|nr:SCO family protein [Spirochaetia bacterium]
MNSEKFSKSGAMALTIWMVGVIALWYIAFSPIATNTSGWLSTVRSICFGAKANGMPAGYGWLTLFFSPLMMLIAILIIWSPSIVINTIRYDSGKISIFFFIFSILFVLFLWEVVWAIRKIKIMEIEKKISYDSFRESKISIESYSKFNIALPNFSFVCMDDNNGETLFGNANIKGPAVLTFAYAHCETICPVILKNSIRGVEDFNLAVSQKQANNSARLYIITLDPWRDTPNMMKVISDEWKLPPFASIITSRENAKINSLLDALNVPRSRNEKTGEIIHPAFVYILDGNSHIIFKLNNPDSGLIRDALHKGI